ERVRAPLSPDDVQAFAIPLAQSAGLAELEATWRYEGMLQAAGTPNLALARMTPYIELQRRRLKLAELASRLEAFAASTGSSRPYVLIAAADAYRSAADPENDLRVLSTVPIEYMGRDVQTHFLELLLARRPLQLVHMGAAWTVWGQQVSDFVVANGDATLVHALVAARAKRRSPVWFSSYNGLAGLYFAEASAEIGKSFVDALGDQTIGERLGKQGDRNVQLAGDIWYYYGSRYGEYLGLTKQTSADDFLVSAVEQSPASSTGYLQLADYYAESNSLGAA